MKPHILGLTTRPASSLTGFSLEHVLYRAQELGATTEFVDLSKTPLPLFNVDQRNPIPEAQQLQAKVAKADALIWATPDYHGCMAGVLKNALDYLWKELAGKLIGGIVSSYEKGLTVHDEMRTVARQCYAWTLPYGISLSEEDWDPAQKTLKNAKSQERLQMMAQDMVSYGEVLRRRFAEDRGQRGFAHRY